MLFSILTSSVTKGIKGDFSIDLCNLSLLCYDDNVLMISSNLFTLHRNLDQLTCGYDCLGFSVKTKITEFSVISSRPCIENSTLICPAPLYVVVCGAEKKRLKYLGFNYG